MDCPASRTHTAGPPDWSPGSRGALCCCVTAAPVPDGSCVTCTPTDTCQDAAASAGAGCAKALSGDKMWLFSSNYKSSAAPQALRPPRHGAYPTAPGARHWAETLNGFCCLLAVCASICWRTDSGWFRGHSGRLAWRQSSDIFPQFPGILNGGKWCITHLKRVQTLKNRCISAAYQHLCKSKWHKKILYVAYYENIVTTADFYII